MKEIVTGGTELRRLEAEVDAELERAESSQDPADLVDPEVEVYEVRLHSLREAVVAMETYEEGLDLD